MASQARKEAAKRFAAYWSTDLSEPEIVSRLFEMYAKLISKYET